MADDVSIRIEADAAPFLQTLDQLRTVSQGFGRDLTGALKSAAVSGKSLDDILRRVGSNMAGRALSAGLAPLSQLTGSLMSNILGGLTGGVTPFAKGGVVSTPSYFPMAGDTGLMGEAGAEAILPLARGSDGRLGVASGAGGSAPVNITFNVTASDAASFRKSEAQITGMLAQAVSRGARGR